MGKIKDYSLYFIISQEYAKDESVLDIAQLAIAAGVDILQMREKQKTQEELIALGNSFKSVCEGTGALFIVNDDPVVAKETNADGVHLGQEDLKKYSLKGARQIIGKDKIIGISTHSLEQFRQANQSDCDYIAFGPIFATQAKDYSIGTEQIQDVLRIAKRSVFFIGGINLNNIDMLLSKGAKNIAVIRALIEAEDIGLRVKNFKHKIEHYRPQK